MVFLCVLVAPDMACAKENSLVDLKLRPMPNNRLRVDFQFSSDLKNVPASFITQKPPRLILDFIDINDKLTENLKSKKIDFIIVSGDNSRKDYDEPSDFKSDLVLAGIPENKIFLDYAGFRTLDSVVRVKEIFGQESVTVISQPFHNERAIYLAEHFDIKIVGFNARAISGRYGLRVKLREYLARVKVFVDVLLGVQPKFLGKKIIVK